MGNIIEEYTTELEVLTSAIRKASALYTVASRDSIRKENRLGIYDLVTKADIEAEDLIKKIISSKYPDDNFVCEESENGDMAGRTWVIDPIDGTINFVKGIPVFGTQVALLEGGKPVVSAIYLPSTDEMYTAIKSKGSFLNGIRIKVSDTNKLADCIMSIGDYSKGSVSFRKNQSILMDAAYDNVARIKMIGASSNDFVMFSSGKTDIHVRFVRDPWDFMPGFLMATEAGGVYNKPLYEKHKLFVIANSASILNEFDRLVIKNMKWV